MMSECTCGCNKCKKCVNKPVPSKTEKGTVVIHVDERTKKKFRILYQSMLETYNKTMGLVHSNFQKRYEKYCKEEEERFNEIYRYTQDPSDIDFSEIGFNASERVAMDLLLRYQFHFSSLVNLYQVFEQQIRKHMYEEINHPWSRVRTTEEMSNFITKFGEIKEFLKTIKYPIGSIPSWSTIDELNKLANVYKHGDGQSAMKLYKKSPGIFANETNPLFYYDEPQSKEEERAYVRSLDEEEKKRHIEDEKILIMRKKLTTNTEIVLREDRTPFKRYSDAIMDFWDAFPTVYQAEVKVGDIEECEKDFV